MLLKKKFYSIQSGHPEKGGSLGRELANRGKIGAVVGGVMGGLISIPALADGKGKLALGITGASAAVLSICSCLTALGATGRAKSAARMSMDDILDRLYEGAYATDDKGERISDINPRRYIVENGDPRNFMATFAFEDGKGVIWLNKPTNPLLTTLNDTLEEIISYNRLADYVAQPTKEGYCVEVICPDGDSFAGIIYNVISDLQIKISVLTDKTIDRAKGQLATKKFSEESNENSKRAGLAIGSGIAGGMAGYAGARELGKHGNKLADKIEWKSMKGGNGTDSYLLQRGQRAQKLAGKVKSAGEFAKTTKGKAIIAGGTALTAGLSALALSRKKKAQEE